MKLSSFTINTAFLLILASACAIVFWLVLHSREGSSALADANFMAMRGQQAPDFTVTTIEGRRFEPGLQHKPMVVEVFATWCDICIAEVPSLNRLATANPNIDVVAITGSDKGSDMSPETLDDLEKFKHSRKVSYNLVLDKATTIARKYKVFGFPSLFFVNQNGKIANVALGGVSYADLESMIHTYLK